MKALMVLRNAATLCRLQIALFAAYSAVTGYLLVPARSATTCVLLGLAVFLLAAGASGLNQYQERDIDARMERTRRRPLPAGAVSPMRALFFAALFIAVGIVTLYGSGGAAPALLGVLAVTWYNGVYTRLKRVTAFAAVPGAVVGMIPLAMGWTMGNGKLNDPRLLALCLLFFMWQVPHFWLQVLHHGEEYEQAGLPSLLTALNRKQISRITFVWICSAAAASLLLPLFGNLTTPLLYAPLLLSAAWIMFAGTRLMSGNRPQAHVPVAFRQLNIFILVIMTLLSAESVFMHML